MLHVNNGSLPIYLCLVVSFFKQKTWQAMVVCKYPNKISSLQTLFPAALPRLFQAQHVHAYRQRNVCRRSGSR